MITDPMAIARERQLDWLLGEVLGDTRRARTTITIPWLAAAIALFALGVAVTLGTMRTAPPDATPAPAAEPVWHECHGPAALAQVPATVTHLRCFDFDDEACGQLGRRARQGSLPALTHLDLSGMDVDASGVSRGIRATDAGVRELAALTTLQWVSFAQCHDVKGAGFTVLEGMPKLEHLDLTYSGIESPAVERLARLPSLRTLVLSHCMNFHGRSLAEVAKLPGLRRLELRACTTLAAADVHRLAGLRELRHLDLRDCQGRFRGQTFSTGAEPDEPPPRQDRIGVTDEVVGALTALPLETLRLGGCESLTDAIGPALAAMTTLRALDLANLPKTNGALLARLPTHLVELVLDDNPQWSDAALATLPALPELHTLGLGGLPQLDDERLRSLLAGKQLTALCLTAATPRDKGGAAAAPRAALTTAAFATLLEQRSLQRLELGGPSPWATPAGLGSLAGLPELRELDLSRAFALDDAAVERLADVASLRRLRLVFCARVRGSSLERLGALPLEELNLYGTACDPTAARSLAAKLWPNARVTLPNGNRFLAPPPPAGR